MSLYATKPVVDIKNIVVIFVIVTFIVRRLAGFCQHATRIVRRFISELRVAKVVSRGDLCS